MDLVPFYVPAMKISAQTALADLTDNLKSTSQVLDNVVDDEDSTDLETRILKSVVDDDKSKLIALTTLLYHQNSSNRDFIDRALVSKFLHLCCAFDSVNCATSLLNGELFGGSVPVVNEIDASYGMTPLHTAAAASSARCVELLLKKYGRTDLKTKDGRALLPLELALSRARMDVLWDADDHSVEDLVVQLSEKDLTALNLVVEKTKEISEVTLARAIEGSVVELAALLMVAAERVNESIVLVHDADSDTKQKATVYESVIKEALEFGRVMPSSKVSKRQCILSESEWAKKRKLLLCEIELLQLFDAVSLTVSTDHKKRVSPLIRACQAGDEAVTELLLKTNIEINDVDSDGNSALHWCMKAQKGSSPQQINIMWLLLTHGARVNQKNKLGLTAIHIAAANGNSQALQAMLLEDPDCINSKTEMKETPLFFAVKNDNKECAEILLDWRASTNVLNLRKQRPIDLAESQDMRFMLNDKKISLKTHALAIQKKCTIFLGNEVSSETCEELLSLTDGGDTTDSKTCSSAMTDSCKYFDSPTGCFRGSKCFYAHAEEELKKIKPRRGIVRSPNGRGLERKIFVGGLPASLNSDILGTYFEENFGPVDDAIVVGVPTGNKQKSRGFGFVTFKDKKSVSAAVEAHYISIMGKEVEIKSAVPKWVLLSQLQKSSRSYQQEENYQLTRAQSPGEETTKEMVSWQTADDKTREETPSCLITEEAEPELKSWADTLIQGQPNKSSIPTWLQIFKKWLPFFLQEISKREEEYALSSLKADFRAAFDLELDHASLGFPKLSEFMRCFPDICRIKHIHMGENKPANHMILLPKLPMKTLQRITKKGPSSQATSHDGSGDGYFDNGKWSQDLVLVSSENDDSTDSSSGASSDILDIDINAEDISPQVPSRFLQFLKRDSILCSGPWAPETGRRHLVLEALARRKNCTSSFFLREFDFYHNYIASIKQGKCFGCNLPRLLLANFPCRHLVWCVACKFLALQAAGNFEHRCVICDVEVQKIDLISRDLYYRPILDRACMSAAACF